VCFQKGNSQFNETSFHPSPLDHGVLSLWFNPDIIKQYAEIRNPKLMNDGELSMLVYNHTEMDLKIEHEFLFEGLTPTLWKQRTLKGEMASSEIHLVENLITNNINADGFDQLFMAIMAEVLRKCQAKVPTKFLESNPPFVNKAGDVFQGNWQKLNLLVMLPPKAPHLDLLMEELKYFKATYPNELLILPVSSTAGTWPQMTKYPDLTEVFTCEAGYLTRNQLSSDEVLILLVNDQRQILAEFKGFYPAQVSRLREGVEKWVE
jgi:hypothetical protein